MDANDGISFILTAFESFSLLALLFLDRVSAMLHMWGIALKIEFVYLLNTFIIITLDNFQLFPTRETLMCILVDDSIDSIQIIDSFFIYDHGFLDTPTSRVTI